MIKKLLASAIIFSFLSVPAWAIQWHNATQATVAWDAVTQLTDDTPIPSTDKVEYEVFRVESRFGDKNNPESLGVVPTLNIVIDFTEGKWFIGVQAIRMTPTEADPNVFEVASRSAIAWSDVPAYCLNSEDFGIRVFKNPKEISGLNKQ
jgi:hypothetical protein